MAMAKVTMVALATAEGDEREFTVEEAETLLRMRPSGWHLPEGSEYELTKDGTISRRSKEKGDGAKKA